MAKNMRWVMVACALMMMVGSLALPNSSGAKTVYVGGTMSLTGPYAEDSAAILAAYEDYVKYVNETKRLAPWRTEKWPADMMIELLWRDDELKPAKALSIYEELKAKGILVYRASGSPTALALKDRLKQQYGTEPGARRGCRPEVQAVRRSPETASKSERRYALDPGHPDARLSRHETARLEALSGRRPYGSADPGQGLAWENADG